MAADATHLNRSLQLDLQPLQLLDRRINVLFLAALVLRARSSVNAWNGLGSTAVTAWGPVPALSPAAVARLQRLDSLALALHRRLQLSCAWRAPAYASVVRTRTLP